MERNDFISQINDLMVHNNIMGEVEKKANQILSNGCVDIDSTDRENYSLAKAALAAILEDVAGSYKNITNRTEYNNIKNFL